jgi:hypothetical protein
MDESGEASEAKTGAFAHKPLDNLVAVVEVVRPMWWEV